MVLGPLEGRDGDPTAAVTAALVTNDGERVELTDPAAGRAELLVRAGRAADPVLVARHTRTAGDIALAAGAWEDARCYYEAALERADAES
jgi:hypothetical protein